MLRLSSRLESDLQSKKVTNVAVDFHASSLLRVIVVYKDMCFLNTRKKIYIYMLSEVDSQAVCTQSQLLANLVLIRANH